MRQFFVPAVFASFQILVAGSAFAEDPVAAGARDYEVYCASCHGVGAIGDGPVAEFLALEPTDLTQLARNAGGTYPEERVRAAIDGRLQVKTHGPRDMPVWGDWFKIEAASDGVKDAAQEAAVQSRIAALTAYIATLQAR